MPGSGGGSAASPPVCAPSADLSLPLQGSDMIMMEQMAQDLVGSKLPFVWPSLALVERSTARLHALDKTSTLITSWLHLQCGAHHAAEWLVVLSVH